MSQPLTLADLGLTTAGPRTRESPSVSKTIERVTPKQASTGPRPAFSKKQPYASRVRASATTAAPKTKKIMKADRPYVPKPEPEPEPEYPEFTQANVEDAYDDAIVKAQQYKVSHIYGIDSTLRTMNMMRAINREYPEDLVLVCFASNSTHIPSTATDSIGLYPKKYNLDSNSCIVSDTVKAKNLLLELAKEGGDRIPSWVIIDSWTYNDIHAHLVYAVIKQFNLDCRVIFSSVTYATPLPETLESTQQTWIPHPGHMVKYIPKAMLGITLSRLDGKSALFTSKDNLGSLNLNTSVFNSPKFAVGGAKYEAVIDDLFEPRSIASTQRAHDFIDNCVGEGIVYRVCASQEVVDKLTPFLEVRWDENEHRIASAFLVGAGMGIEEVLPGTGKIYTDKVNQLMNKFDISKKQLSIAKSLGILPGGPTVMYFKQPVDTVRGAYISALVCALSSITINGVALKKYDPLRKFAGRNDIETLANMWQSLLLADVSKPFFEWPSHHKAVDSWCKENSFIADPAMKLLEIMTNIAKSSKKDAIVEFITARNITSEELSLVSSYMSANLFKARANGKPMSYIPHKVDTHSRGLRVPYESKDMPRLTLVGASEEKYITYVLPVEDFSDI